MSIGGSKASVSRRKDSPAKAKRLSRDRFRRMSLRIICTSLLAWLLLGVYRGVILDPQTTFQDMVATIPRGLAASYYDLVLIASVTVALTAVEVATPVPQAKRMVFCLAIVETFPLNQAIASGVPVRRPRKNKHS